MRLSRRSDKRLKDIIWGVIGIILLAMFGFNVQKTIEHKYKNKRTET